MSILLRLNPLFHHALQFLNPLILPLEQKSHILDHLGLRTDSLLLRGHRILLDLYGLRIRGDDVFIQLQNRLGTWFCV